MSNSKAVLLHEIKNVPWPSQRPVAPSVMIIDTCSLSNLATSIPDSFFKPGISTEGRPKTYLDIVKMLPREVIDHFYIPDIVLYEATGFAPTGEKIKKQELLEQINQAIEYAQPQTNRAILEFVGCLGKNKNERVVIGHFPESKEFFKKIKPYYQRVDKKIAELEMLTGRPYHEKTRVLSELAQLRERATLAVHEYGDNFGEIKCAEYGCAYAINHNAYVSFLSNDYSARRMFNHNVRRNPRYGEMQTNELNTGGLYQAFKETGILKKLGFREEVTAEEIDLAACQNASKIVLRPQRIIDLSRGHEKAFCERMLHSPAIKGNSIQSTL